MRIIILIFVENDDMSRTEKNKLEYTVALIADFAAAFNLSKKQTYNYLQRFKGLDFFFTHYNVMHTQSFEDTISDLVLVCSRNGGRLA